MQLLFSKLISGKSILLDETESRHLKVMRLGLNDTIHVTDGEGNLYESRITHIGRGQATAEILKSTKPQPEKDCSLHIAISPTKNIDRFEWFLEKATEIGVSEISPLICHRSERVKINTERLQRILVSAIKQSLRTIIPRLNSPVSFNEFIKRNITGQGCIASCMQSDIKELQYVYTTGSDLVVLIGPEGDFTGEEIAKALEVGFKAVSLGESRLRTETAGVYISALFNILNTKIN
jgi:16S rRNA (uracil1498-N3)-methyltransferase